MSKITVYGYSKSPDDLKTELINGLWVARCATNSSKGIDVYYKDQDPISHCNSIEESEAYIKRNKGTFIENFISFALSNSDEEDIFPDGVENFIKENEMAINFLTLTLAAFDINNQPYKRLSTSKRDITSNISGILISDTVNGGGGFTFGDVHHCNQFVKRWVKEYEANEYLQDAFHGIIRRGLYLEEYYGTRIYLLSDCTFLAVKYEELLIPEYDIYLIQNEIPVGDYDIGETYDEAADLLSDIISIIEGGE